MTARTSAWRRWFAVGAVAAALVVGAGVGAAPAAAAAPAISVTAPEIGLGDTVTIAYDAGGPGAAKNWVGIYRHGTKPGSGTSSLDWRYAPGASGGFAWGPQKRD